MPAPKRYALIQDDKLLWGPAPQPYFVNLPNGDLLEVAAHSTEEREAVGLLRVEQRDWREIDPEIERAETPLFAIENGGPVETWSYRFTPGARQAMRRRIDAQAEIARAEYITATPGQVMEYGEAYREAQAVLALPADAPILPGQFPFLECDIDRTDLPGAGRKVETVREAASVVAGERGLWQVAGAAIRAKRLAAKAAIAAAASDVDAHAAYLAAWE